MNSLQYVLKKLDTAVAACSRVCIVAGGLIIFCIAIVGALDMITSFSVNYPIPAATTLAEELLPAAVLLATGFVVRQRANIVVDVLTERMGGIVRTVFALFAVIVTFVFFALLTWGAWELASSSILLWEYAVAAVEFPVWPMKLAYAIGATVATLESARLIVLVITGDRLDLDPDLLTGDQ